MIQKPELHVQLNDDFRKMINEKLTSPEHRLQVLFLTDIVINFLNKSSITQLLTYKFVDEFRIDFNYRPNVEYFLMSKDFTQILHFPSFMDKVQAEIILSFLKELEINSKKYSIAKVPF